MHSDNGVFQSSVSMRLILVNIRVTLSQTLLENQRVIRHEYLAFRAGIAQLV